MNFTDQVGRVATVSVRMLLAWGLIAGAQQQPAKVLAITPKLTAVKWSADALAGVTATPNSSRLDYIKLSGVTSTTLPPESPLKSPGAVANNCRANKDPWIRLITAVMAAGL